MQSKSMRTHVCLQCGSSFDDPQYQQRKFCGRACYAENRTKPPEERFWSRVIKSDEPDGCWIFQGTPNIHGYHTFYVSSTWKEGAHRYAWILKNGPIPEGYEICHNCPNGDNPACVRDEHLWLGTHAQNMADMDAKGRRAVGERNHAPRGSAQHKALLIESQVLEIRSLYASGVRPTALSEQFRVSCNVIYYIVHRKTWAWL